MRVRVKPQLQIFIALVVAPDLSETQEEALLRCKPVDLFRSRFFRERFLQRSISQFYSADVGDVLTLGQLTIDMQSRQWLVGSILSHDPFRALEVCFRRRRCPPIAQITDGIILPSPIIEAMRHLMSDYGAHSAVVDGVIRLRIEEWRLKNTGREYDLV